MKLLKYKPLQYIIVGLIVACIPFLTKVPRSTMTIFNTVVIYAIIAIGFNILLGYAGQISLGHAAFMGLGAYVSAYITSTINGVAPDAGWAFPLALVLSGLVPMVIGLILGLIALRLEGHYLAIATLGFGVTIQHVFKEWIAFTNGYSGIKAMNVNLFGLVIKSRDKSFFFALAITILVLLAIFAYNLLKSKTGRALIAMRDSEHAAQAMGVSLFKYKLVAFAVSAFYAGIAGSLYVHLVGYTYPDDWGIMLSLNLLAMVVIGGLASIEGSIIGAAFIVLTPHYLSKIPALEGIRSLSTILTGIALVLVIMFLPYGIARIGPQIKGILQERKDKKAAVNQE